MGVNLSGLSNAHTVELNELSGKKVAIDAYNTIYQFLSTIRQPDGYPLTDGKGRVTSHLSGLLYRTVHLIEVGIEPVFVFDGKPHVLKSATLSERRERRDKAEQEWKEAIEEGDLKKAFSKAQQTSRMTDEIRDSSKRLIELLGLPVVQAPSDGEAQAAYMCLKGDVWASASQDYDSLLFGTPRLVRNMTIAGRRKVPGKDLYKDLKTEIVDTEEFLNSLGITREGLVDVCILMGTDFNDGISGIGPKKGLKLIKDYGNIENALNHINKTIEGYEEVRDIFLHGEYTDDYSVSYGSVDKDGVMEFMTDYGFSETRVSGALDKIENSRKTNKAKRAQKSLDSWF